MTNPTFTDNRGKTQTVEIGMKYAGGYGRTITVEGFDTRQLGSEDSRDGAEIVYGPMSQDGEETYPIWEYLDSLEYAIPTIAQIEAQAKKAAKMLRDAKRILDSHR